MHLLYEIARAKSIGILRGGAPALVMAISRPKLPSSPPPPKPSEEPSPGARFVDEQHAKEVAFLREALRGMKADHDRAMESLRLQYVRAPAAAMVDTFMAAMPPNPFTVAALTAGEEMQARRLFCVALAKQRKGWGLHEVLTEIDRATFIELIQNLAIGENEAVGAQQLPPPSAESIGAAFDKADADGSSTVSEAEFLRLFLEVKTGLAPSFLGSSFFGADGSGLDFNLNNWASGFVGKGGGD